MINKKSPSYKVMKTKIFQLIDIALIGIILIISLYSSLGNKVIWIAIAIVLIELIVSISNEKLDFFYKKYLWQTLEDNKDGSTK